jgi:hypothetical protein
VLIRPLMMVVPLLAMMPVEPVQAIGEPFSDARGVVTAGSQRPVHLAVFQAPVGHRQPTLEDLPPWLREQEKPAPNANPAPDAQQRKTPKGRPDDGVPRICDPC